MSRIQTLKRLGVAGVAVITMGAGVPVFFASSAQAATTASFTITPAENQTAAAGDCLAFTVTAKDASGANATDTPTVTVVVSETTESPEDTVNEVQFCAPAGVSSTPSGESDRAQFQTVRTADNTASQVVFGVTRSDAGSVRIVAFQDLNNDGDQDAGEPGSTNVATATFTATNFTSSEARNIDLEPENSTTTTNQRSETFTATVVDAAGTPVAGAQVTFTLTGPGEFILGDAKQGKTVTATTDNSGRASVATITEFGATGTQTITATLSAAATDCDRAAGDPAGSTAGNCADSVTNTVTPAPVQPSSPSPSATTTSPSPSATPTASVSPSAPATTPPASTTANPMPACQKATVSLDREFIIATGSANVTWSAADNSIVDLFAYTRPQGPANYRVVRSTEDGSSTDRIVPPANTRLYALQRGCAAEFASESIVLNVRTQLSLNVERLGKQTYRFFGSAIPARPNGLIVSLYRVTDSGRQVLTSQVRANANVGQPGYDSSRPAGSYSITRKFTGTGRFGFVVRTGQDLQNAPGSSNVRSLLIF